MASQKILVLGGTGLVGRCLVELAAARPTVSEVIAPVRRLPAGPSARPSEKVRWLVVDFKLLEAQAPLFEVAAVVCALGTTIGKAGSRAAFEAIDLELPLRAARLARKAGVARFGLVSSAGAAPASPVPYLRTKGQLEAALGALGFEVLVIAQPSLLLGARPEPRFGESLAKVVLSPLSSLVPRGLRPIRAEQVAERLLDATLERRQGLHRLDNAALLR